LEKPMEIMGRGYVMWIVWLAQEKKKQGQQQEVAAQRPC
jgi:hypothetical protein